MRGLVLILLLMADRSAAGAWPRGAGESFVSLSTAPDAGEYGIYLERGVGESLTFGGKLDDYGDGTRAGEVFARKSLALTPQTYLAFEIGLGAVVPETGPEVTAFGAVMLGRGLETPFGNGWVDTRSEIGWIDGRRYTGFDAVLGTDVTERQGVFLEVNSFFQDEAYVTVIPSHVFDLTDRIRAVTGLSHDIAGGSDTQITFDLWVNF